MLKINRNISFYLSYFFLNGPYLKSKIAKYNIYSEKDWVSGEVNIGLYVIGDI